MDLSKDYYAILGILPSAEAETIQAVYRVLSKKYHPDITKENKAEAEEKIREINEAYDVLSDEEKKREYDSSRVNSGSEKNTFYEEDVDQGDASSHSDPKIEESWGRIAEYYPEFEGNRRVLDLLSQDLSMAYKIYLITEKSLKAVRMFI